MQCFPKWKRRFNDPETLTRRKGRLPFLARRHGTFDNPAEAALRCGPLERAAQSPARALNRKQKNLDAPWLYAPTPYAAGPIWYLLFMRPNMRGQEIAMGTRNTTVLIAPAKLFTKPVA